jgi:DNA-binding transcriptional regulator LsrR (DeoR family)
MREPVAVGIPSPRVDTVAVALASQVARMFFDREMTKVQIAANLGISRFRVARLIEFARQQGLVQIEFRDIPAQDRELARAIEERWRIDLCVVAAAEPGDGEGGPPLARLAAAVITELIGPREIIGIAWGSTLAAVVGELPARTSPDVHVVQLAGSSGRVERIRNPGELARILADRLGGAYHALFAPAFVESPALRDALLREPEIEATVSLFDRVSLAIVGIGAFAEGNDSSSSLVHARVLTDDDLGRLLSEGAVGDLILYPFDADGRFVADQLGGRAVAVTTDQLAGIPRVIAVAGGALKAEAIAGALSTGIVRMLVTDEPAAERIVALPARVRATGQGRTVRSRHLPGR